jgi:hypothetical protein
VHFVIKAFAIDAAIAFFRISANAMLFRAAIALFPNFHHPAAAFFFDI